MTAQRRRRLEIRGPFHSVNYLRPALIFGLPTLVFYLGVAFYLGERCRRPVTVFLFPIAVMLVCGFFLWNWAPTWLDPRINRLLMLVDPAGFRWLNETWIKLDRGAGFYNTARVGLDLPFVLSRLAFLALGLAGVWLAPAAPGRPSPGSVAGGRAWRGRGAGRALAAPARRRRGARPCPRRSASCGCARGDGRALRAAPWRWRARSCGTSSPRPASTCSAPSSCCETLGDEPARPGGVPDRAADHARASPRWTRWNRSPCSSACS